MKVWFTRLHYPSVTQESLALPGFLWVIYFNILPFIEKIISKTGLSILDGLYYLILFLISLYNSILPPLLLNEILPFLMCLHKNTPDFTSYVYNTALSTVPFLAAYYWEITHPGISGWPNPFYLGFCLLLWWGLDHLNSHILFYFGEKYGAVQWWPFSSLKWIWIKPIN